MLQRKNNCFRWSPLVINQKTYELYLNRKSNRRKKTVEILARIGNSFCFLAGKFFFGYPLFTSFPNLNGNLKSYNLKGLGFMDETKRYYPKDHGCKSTEF
jgi:hypothetical protein